MPAIDPLCSRLDGPRSLQTWQVGFLLALLLTGYLSIAVSQITLGAGLALMLAGWAVCHRPPVRTGMEWPVALLAAWALLMVPLSTDVGQSAVYYKRFFLFTAIWVAASVADDERRRMYMAWLFFAGGGVAAFQGFIDALTTSGGLFDIRMHAVSNPMTSGAMMMMVALVAVGFVIGPGMILRRRLLIGALALVLLLSFAMTMTRSAFLGFFAGLGLMLLMARPRVFLVFYVVAALGAVAVLTTGESWLSPRMWSRVNPAYVMQGQNTVLRLEMWKGGLEMVKAHPLTGVGDRGLEDISRQYYVSARNLYFGHMHNNFVHLAVIWGVPGLLLGTWFLFAPVWILVRRWVRLANEVDAARAPPVLKAWVLGVAGAWSGFIVAGMTEWYVGDAETMLIALAVLGVSLGPRDRNDDDDGPPRRARDLAPPRDRRGT